MTPVGRAPDERGLLLFGSARGDLDPDAGREQRPALLNSDRKFRTFFETSCDAILLLSGGKFLHCNSATLAMFQVPSVEEFKRLHPADLSPPLQPCGVCSHELADKRISEALATGRCRFEWVHRRMDGEDFETDVLVSRYDEGGLPLLQATVRDISEMKRLQRALIASHRELAVAHEAMERQNRELALLCVTDQLTGLFNRRKLDEVIQSECSRARRTRQAVSLIIADLDHFKKINDTLGHQEGDRLLRRLAALMQQNIRADDILGRWGGEEFLLVAPGTTAREASVLAHRLRGAVQTIQLPGFAPTTCSFGVAGYEPSLGVDAMMRRADDALYAAKAAGRNQVMVHDGA